MSYKRRVEGCCHGIEVSLEKEEGGKKEREREEMMLLYFLAKYKQETHAHVFVLEELSASYRVSSLTVFPWEGKEELSALQISGRGVTMGGREKKVEEISLATIHDLFMRHVSFAFKCDILMISILYMQI